MKTFKAKHNKGFYKSTDAWIDAIYRNNKEVIDDELGFHGKPKKVFKQMVNEYIDEGMSPTKAVNTIARSTLFTPVVERLKNNFWSAIKADKAAYKEFRELTKEHGRFTKFDVNKLKWDKTDKVYTYGSLIISFQNSPYGIRITA